MTYFAEWNMKEAKHTAYFVDTAELDNLVGHATVYKYTEECKVIMENQGSIVGCSNFPVFTDKFMIDLDDGDESIRKVCQQLVDRELAYSVWSTGGKGYHLEIPCIDMFGIDVPHSQLEYAKTIDGVHDFNVYRHNSLLRLPGTIHQKSGKPKVKVYERPGNAVEIPIVRNPQRFMQWEGIEAHIPKNSLELGFRLLYRLMLEPPSIGGRHVALWSCASNLQSAGLTKDTVADLLLNVNRCWDVSKGEPEIIKIVTDLYGDSHDSFDY